MKSLLLCLIALLSGCDNASAPVTRTVKVWLGDTTDAMQSALGEDLTRDCDDTMCWYNFTKPSQSGNTLNLVLGGDRPFTLDGVFSLPPRSTKRITIVLMRSISTPSACRKTACWRIAAGGSISWLSAFRPPDGSVLLCRMIRACRGQK